MLLYNKGGTYNMRFNAKAYEELFPRQEKPVVNIPEDIDPEDQMVEVPKEVKDKEEIEDGTGADGKPDIE